MFTRAITIAKKSRSAMTAGIITCCVMTVATSITRTTQKATDILVSAVIATMIIIVVAMVAIP